MPLKKISSFQKAFSPNNTTSNNTLQYARIPLLVIISPAVMYLRHWWWQIHNGNITAENADIYQCSMGNK